LAYYKNIMAEGELEMEPVFDDGDTVKALLTRMYNLAENISYEKMLKQADNDPMFEWGAGLNVLLLADEAIGRVLGLFMYLSTKTRFSSVKMCLGIEDVTAYLDSGVVPDIVIFAGMPKEVSIYQVMHMISGQAMIVMYDFLDAIVEAECRLQGIRYAFSSCKPIREGLVYLREVCEAYISNR